MAKRTVFEPFFITDAKKAVRGDFYWNIHKMFEAEEARFPRRQPRSFFILPGMHPKGEIGGIRALWPDSKITAFDSYQPALDEALKAGADEVKKGELENINIWGAHEEMRTRYFEVMNLDLCSPIKVTFASNGSQVRSAGKRASRVVAVFVSYGRESKELMNSYMYYGKRWKAFAVNRPYHPEIDELPVNLLGRLDNVVREMGNGDSRLSKILRVYFYKGRTPMMGVVLGSPFEDAWEPIVRRVRNADLAKSALEADKSLGTAVASALFDVDLQTLADWKKDKEEAKKLEKELRARRKALRWLMSP